MRARLTSLRVRFRALRRGPATPDDWAVLRADVRDTMHDVQQRGRSVGAVADVHGSDERWVVIAEAFWVERDLQELAIAIEEACRDVDRPAARPPR